MSKLYSTAWLLAVGLLVPALGAADLSGYRGMQFGATIAAASKLASVAPSEARTLHKRPALIQEMDWQPRPLVTADPEKADSVRGGVLYFCNGELFRIVVIYDRYKVLGMTPQDMIDGISTVYGTPTRPNIEIPYHSIYGETSAVAARWEDARHAYNLVQNGEPPSYALVLYSKALDEKAQAAIAEAVRLDAKEAPQRELDEQKQRDRNDNLELEKARSVNKVNFRP